jgi:hypothetical protein
MIVDVRSGHLALAVRQKLVKPCLFRILFHSALQLVDAERAIAVVTENNGILAAIRRRRVPLL